MPKGTKYFQDGSMTQRYTCPCGFSKLSSSCKQTKLIDKLHMKICEIAKNANLATQSSMSPMEHGHSGLMIVLEASYNEAVVALTM